MAQRAAAAAVVGCLTLGSALAAPETITLDGRALSAAAPEGYCALAPAQPREAEIMAYAARLQAGRNQLVLAFADCAELTQFRAGSRQEFDHHGLVLAIMQNGAVRHVDGISRGDFIELMAQSMPALDPAAVNAELRERVAAAGGATALGELKPLGTLDRNADGIYAGFVIGGADAAATKLAVMGLTLVNEIPLAMYLYEPLAGASIEKLVAAQRANLHALVAANVALEAPDGLAAYGWPGAVLAVLVAAGLVGLVLLVRRRITGAAR